MARFSEITPILQKCLDDPGFTQNFCERLRAAHPEFRALYEKMDEEEFIFNTRKCITTAMLCASGALKTRVMLQRMERCRDEMWGRSKLFPLWIDCLIRTVNSYYPLPDGLQTSWRKSMIECHAAL